MGAFTADADEEIIETLYQVGLNAGIAFQIKDDLLDYVPGGTGKKAYADLKEQKLTLPVIHALNNSSFAESMKYKGQLKQIRKRKRTPVGITDWLKTKGSLEYAEAKMEEYRNMSLKLLRTLPETRYRSLTEQTINFLTQRNY